MAGGGSSPPFDPCECIFSHEGAMRRLISLVGSLLDLKTHNRMSNYTPHSLNVLLLNVTLFMNVNSFVNTSVMNLHFFQLRGSQSYCTDEQCFGDGTYENAMLRLQLLI